jgi:transaldolase
LTQIPATENGVVAAKELEAAGIRTNLIFVASIMHAAICAQAGATTISIAVGPVRSLPLSAVRATALSSPCREQLLLCHERKRNTIYPELARHPGMEIIQATLEYFKLHKIPTLLVGRDFRQVI